MNMEYTPLESGKTDIRFKLGSRGSARDFFDYFLVPQLREFYGSQGIGIDVPAIGFDNGHDDGDVSGLKQKPGIKLYKKSESGIYKPMGVIGISYYSQPAKKKAVEGAGDYNGSDLFVRETVRDPQRSISLFFNIYESGIHGAEEAQMRTAERDNFVKYLGHDAKIFGLPLSEKRKRMQDFLLENIVAGKKWLDEDKHEIYAEDRKENLYSLLLLSKQEDFPFGFTPDASRFDNDGEMLKQLFAQVIDYVIEKNGQGITPGFMFLRAETDYWQLIERVARLANHGSFLKQKLSDGVIKKPHSDHKVLDPLEVCVAQLHRKTANGKGLFPRNHTYYYHGPNYFNTKERERPVEVSGFSDLKNPRAYKLDKCPACSLPNGEKYDHEACKEEPAYISYLKNREIARYEKNITFTMHRKAIASEEEKKSAENGVVLQKSAIDLDEKKISKEFPQFAGKSITIATIK